MLSVALAGKPNAGKSTFYTAATQSDVDVGNYPFTTIDHNRGVSYVRTDCPCLDLSQGCDHDDCRGGKRYVPVELLDVAGLVPGAHEGRGLGNQFLDELSDADVILNVVDVAGATDAEGEPVEPGTHDPVEDVDFVEREMDLWLADVIGRNWEGIERACRSPDFDFDAELTDMLTGIGATPKTVATVLREVDTPENPRDWTDEDREALATAVRARTKPIVVVGNKVDLADEETVERVREAADRFVPATADGELALRNAADADVVDYDPGDESFAITGDVSDEQRAGLETIRDVMDRWGSTGIQQSLNEAVYDVLDQITVYPVENETHWTDGQGRQLPDAFLLPDGASPRDLAYAVHSDIGDAYLHAVDAREQRRIGEDATLAEGDVIKIVSSAS